MCTFADPSTAAWPRNTRHELAYRHDTFLKHPGTLLQVMSPFQEDDISGETHCRHCPFHDGSLPPAYTPRQPVRPGFAGGTTRFTMLSNTLAYPYSRPASTWPSFKVSKAVPWHAELDVWANHMPTLMKDGSFWSEHDIDMDENFFMADVSRFSSLSRDMGWTHARVYNLIDRQHDDCPRWKATLTVYGHDYNMLQQFKPHELTLENIIIAAAVNTKGELIYLFNRNDSSDNFNAIFGGMPLLGWWPWPKQPDSEEHRSLEDEDRGAGVLIHRSLIQAVRLWLPGIN